MQRHVNNNDGGQTRTSGVGSLVGPLRHLGNRPVSEASKTSHGGMFSLHFWSLQKKKKNESWWEGRDLLAKVLYASVTHHQCETASFTTLTGGRSSNDVNKTLECVRRKNASLAGSDVFERQLEEVKLPHQQEAASGTLSADY